MVELALGLGAMTLIAFVALFALLHPDPARRAEAAKILDRLLSVLPWSKLRTEDGDGGDRRDHTRAG